MCLLLLGALDLFLGGGRGLLVVYGETGDGRINFGERDSHGGGCGSLLECISWIDQMIDGKEEEEKKEEEGGGEEKDKKGRETRGGSEQVTSACSIETRRGFELTNSEGLPKVIDVIPRPA